MLWIYGDLLDEHGRWGELRDAYGDEQLQHFRNMVTWADIWGEHQQTRKHRFTDVLTCLPRSAKWTLFSTCMTTTMTLNFVLSKCACSPVDPALCPACNEQRQSARYYEHKDRKLVQTLGARLGPRAWTINYVDLHYRTYDAFKC